MKKHFLLTTFLLSFVFVSFAQPFTKVNTGLVQVSRGTVVFADFNNDHALDIFIAGQDNSYNPVAQLYQNNAGTFEAIESGISGLYNCSAAAADYDGDGWMDIVITGEDFDGIATRLYRNSGNGQFELIDAGFYAAGADGDLAWGDYNNDGYPDLVISGRWQTKLYRNNGDGSFTFVESGLPGMNSPSVSWGDSDNDGDLDLLMSGDAGSVADAFIYVNDNGYFTKLDVALEGAVGGMASWGDYNNDGKPDVLISGKDPYLTPVAYLYQNNGDNTFTFINAGLTGTALGPADWIDFDNDGDLDIMLSGQNSGCGNVATRLYENDGNGNFSEIPAGLIYAEKAASAWGDFDNDGDYDLVLTGLSGNNITYLYRNDLLSSSFIPNTPPSVPEGLLAYVIDDYVLISWDRSSDQQSPTAAISYNVMVGSTPGAVDVVSPMSNTATGQRFIPAFGNCGPNDFLEIQNLPNGTYYVRVQAIDQAYAGSAFSEEVSFTILTTNTSYKESKPLNFRIEHDMLFIQSNINEAVSYTVLDMQGRKLTSGKTNGSNMQISLNGLNPGVYVVQITGSDQREVVKFFKM